MRELEKEVRDLRAMKRATTASEDADARSQPKERPDALAIDTVSASAEM